MMRYKIIDSQSDFTQLLKAIDIFFPERESHAWLLTGRMLCISISSVSSQISLNSEVII